MATPNGNLSADGHHVGKVVQIIGPVLDVEFQGGYLPPIYQALRVVSDGFDVPTPIDVIAEVQQHLGEGRVRTVSMTPTDGMVRGDAQRKVLDQLDEFARAQLEPSRSAYAAKADEVRAVLTAEQVKTILKRG